MTAARFSSPSLKLALLRNRRFDHHRFEAAERARDGATRTASHSAEPKTVRPLRLTPGIAPA